MSSKKQQTHASENPTGFRNNFGSSAILAQVARFRFCSSSHGSHGYGIRAKFWLPHLTGFHWSVFNTPNVKTRYRFKHISCKFTNTFGEIFSNIVGTTHKSNNAALSEQPKFQSVLNFRCWTCSTLRNFGCSEHAVFFGKHLS